MKKNFITIILISIFVVSCVEPKTQESKTSSENCYNPNELIFVVEMDSNENKSTEDITQFSKYYTDTIDKNEPHSLGWGFYKSGDQIVLIERYLDDAAMMQHGKNVSQGGPLEPQFLIFMDHFTINKIDVYGNASEELKESVKPFGLPFYFHSAYAKFSRSTP